MREEPGKALISSLAYLLMNLSIRPYVEIDTAYGRLRGGQATARNGNPYAEFLNVPYALPPVGDLRFESPLPPFSWKGVQDASYYGNSCLQYDFLTHFLVGGEDCLNLNVYTNQVGDDGRLKPGILKPVIVYFYGGWFMSGFSAVYRAKYFMEEEVVLVTVNYRVNALGFLNTGDGLIRGNMGLKDQVRALRWVKKNIQFFGGDPNLVTIMGESAGGASVHFHLMSHRSTGLFQRAISLSGTVLNPWAFTADPKEHAASLAKKLGCASKNAAKVASCLKSVHSHRIVRVQKDYLKRLGDPSTLFGPSIESIDDANSFLTVHPRVLLKNGTYPNHVPWMTGVTNAEGLLTSLYLLKQPMMFQTLESNWNEMLPHIFGNKGNFSKNISSATHKFYFGDEIATAESLDKVVRLYSDGHFNLPLFEAVKYQAKVSRAPVYAYYFTYARDFGLANIFTGMVGRGPRVLDYGLGAARTWLQHKVNPDGVPSYGVCHGDELGLLFNIPTFGDEITPGSKDHSFSAAFVKLIVSFARDGDPGNFLGKKWNPVKLREGGTFPLFQIGGSPGHTDNTGKNNAGNIPLPFQDSVNFWQKILKFL